MMIIFKKMVQAVLWIIISVNLHGLQSIFTLIFSLTLTPDCERKSALLIPSLASGSCMNVVNGLSRSLGVEGAQVS